MSVFKKFFTLFLLSGVFGFNAPEAKASGWMQTAEAVPPPIGFVMFCAQRVADCRVRYQSAQKMAFDQRSWSQLQQVQAEINRAIVARSDQESVGKKEQWSYAENGFGDCEDYALRKKQALVDKGWPSESLLLTTAITEKGEKHVVLTAVTSKGDYILDNRFSEPKTWDELAYNWIARQDPLNPLIWRKASGYGDSRLASLR